VGVKVSLRVITTPPYDCIPDNMINPKAESILALPIFVLFSSHAQNCNDRIGLNHF